MLGKLEERMNLMEERERHRSVVKPTFGVLDSSLLNSSLVLCLLPLEELTVTEILPLFSLEGVLAWPYLCLSTPDAGCDNATVT